MTPNVIVLVNDPHSRVTITITSTNLFSLDAIIYYFLPSYTLYEQVANMSSTPDSTGHSHDDRYLNTMKDNDESKYADIFGTHKDSV